MKLVLKHLITLVIAGGIFFALGFYRGLQHQTTSTISTRVELKSDTIYLPVVYESDSIKPTVVRPLKRRILKPSTERFNQVDTLYTLSGDRAILSIYIPSTGVSLAKEYVWDPDLQVYVEYNELREYVFDLASDSLNYHIVVTGLDVTMDTIQIHYNNKVITDSVLTTITERIEPKKKWYQNPFKAGGIGAALVALILVLL